MNANGISNIPFREDMLERDIEQALVRDVTKLLL